jgi:thiol-disulfide isomerase/thioredoxin
VAPVKVRKRLLLGSLATAAVASVAIGWAISRAGHDSSADDTVVIDGGEGQLQPPSIETNAVVKGHPLPDVDVQTVDGVDVAVQSLIGQPMVINVWGSTCVPCKKELPDFAAAHLTYGDRVRFVGIDYLPPSDREENFARDKGVQYELLYDANGAFINDVGIAAFPVTLFVNADGTIVRQTGLLDEAKIAQYIESDLL